MEKKVQNEYKGHVIAIPYPIQGHINPLLQFCKHLSTTRPIKTTLALTEFLSSTLPPQSIPGVGIDTFSDGHDSDGFAGAESTESYIATMEAEGRRSISGLIRRHAASGNPVTCLIYDSILTWALDVAKDHGIVAAAFFTQPCTVNYIYHGLKCGVFSISDIKYPVTVPGVELERSDMPSFVGEPGSHAAYFKMVLNQYSNVHLADFILVNSFHELEPQLVELMSKETPLLPIGPTLPSSYLDKTNMDDKDYGLSLFNSSPSSNATAIEWLRTKPPGSVIYVSFGSMWCLEKEQIEEVAWALKHCQYNFLWVVKFAERPRLPEGFIEEMSTLGKAMFLEWCSQLQVLENDAVGCFVTHSGWNSTLEALAFGVPLVCMPQWSDQPTNAKLVQDLWKVGVKAHRDESGIVPREELGKCIIEVMKGDKGEGMRGNARKWSALAKQAFADGGSSACNVDLFVSKFSR